MVSMTPIDYFLISGMAVYTVDAVGTATLVAVAASHEQLDWLVWSLGEAHKKPVEYLNGPVAGHLPRRDLPTHQRPHVFDLPDTHSDQAPR